MFLQLFQKCRGQPNQPFPLQQIINSPWLSPALQFQFIKNSIGHFQAKKDKLLSFNKLKNKVAVISELEIKDRGESAETVEVWQSVDLVERLCWLSDKAGMFMPVRKLMEHPMRKIPEVLLLTISQSKPQGGHILIDELLSVLLPTFLGSHNNSSSVLQKLFEFNSKLFVRGICELCKHDQKYMNLSRVLDITQEVKESLLEVVNCEDFAFAVKLGILSGKRDYLHYDAWVQARIKEVGSPFIEALLDYIQDLVINPVSEFVKKN